MILRSFVLELPLFLSFLAVSFVKAADFDCNVTVDDFKFDLTDLAGEFVVNRTRITPPSTMIDSLRFNLCTDLKKLDSLSEYDQCPTGTRACLTKSNTKDDERERVISVIPIAQMSTLNASYSARAPMFLSMQLHGPSYSTNSIPQTLNVTLFCNPSAKLEPQFIAYDGSTLDLEWRTPAGCNLKGDDGDDDDGGNKGGDDKGDEGSGGKDEKNVGSGIGWFFLVIILAFASYFGLGAYYNYSTYGASGYDLIPHRDFWKEVPYMLSDVVSHLCSNVRPRRTSSRGGYVSV